MFPILNINTNASKFKVGTRIKSKTMGQAGVVTGVSFNSIYGEMEFYAKMDFLVGNICISETDANSMWEVESPAPPPDSATIEFTPENPYEWHGLSRQLMSSCNHKWSTYHGLKETFDYCTTCDEKKVK